MSKNVTVNATAVMSDEVKKTPTKTAEFAINAMRRPILLRAISGSRKAVSKDEALDGGCSASAFKSWKSDIQDLYDSACEFYETVAADNGDGSNAEAIAEAKAECLKVWRRILRAGEETPLQPRMYVRDSDAHNLRVWACECETRLIRGVGLVGVYTGIEKFRGIIETRIALRIAGNAILKDTDREILDTYDSAVKTIKSCEQILNGYQQGNTVVPSIDAQITDAKNTLNKIVEALTAAGQTEDTIRELTGRQKQLVSDLMEAKDTAEKRLAKATKTREATQSSYDEIAAKLDAIEGFLDETPTPTETPEQIKERHAAERARSKNQK